MNSIYREITLENEIEQIASANEGEIPEEAMQALVEAQTHNIESINKMIKYVRHLEFFIDNCKTEENRIKKNKSVAENTLNSIKKYLTPFIKAKAKGKFTAGSFRLSTRKSTKVDLIDNFNNPDYCVQTISYVPDKKLIKKDLEKGIKIEGAKLIESDNLQIK